MTTYVLLYDKMSFTLLDELEELTYELSESQMAAKKRTYRDINTAVDIFRVVFFNLFTEKFWKTL